MATLEWSDAQPGSQAATPAASGASIPVRLCWLLLLLLAVAAPASGGYALYRSGSELGPAAAWALFGLNLAALLFLMAASVLLFRKRSGDPVAALLAIAYLATGISLHFGEGSATAPGFESFRLALEVLAIVCTTLAMLRFPDGRFVPAWSRFIVLPLVGWAIARWSHLLPDQANVFVSIAVMLFSMAAVLFRYTRLPQGPQRQQVRWVLFGFAIGLSLNLVSVILFTRLSLPLGREELIWTWVTARALNTLFVVVMALGMLVSLLRYRLYDVDTVISRSAGFAVMTAVLIATFAATEKVVEMLGQQWLGGRAGALTASVAAAVVALLIAPLHNRAQDWAERRFRKNLVHLRRSLPECAADLRETATLPELAGEVLRQIASGVRPRHAAVLVGDKIVDSRGIASAEVERWAAATELATDADELECERRDALFPLRMPLRVSYVASGTPLGWILLGPRPDGSFYSSDEQRTLTNIAGPVARALSVAAAREARLLDDQRRWEQQSARIAGLEERVEQLSRSSHGDANPEAASR